MRLLHVGDPGENWGTPGRCGGSRADVGDPGEMWGTPGRCGALTFLTNFSSKSPPWGQKIGYVPSVWSVAERTVR